MVHNMRRAPLRVFACFGNKNLGNYQVDLVGVLQKVLQPAGKKGLGF